MSEEKLRYSIQEHDATRLHYDLRLEIDGVLKSWAIPKEPSDDPNVKRLAVETEDHDLDYYDFEGEIPEGSYGAGSVKVWDIGTHEPVSIKENKIITRITGKKFKGEFVLIRFRPKEQPKNWLFFRKNKE